MLQCQDIKRPTKIFYQAAELAGKAQPVGRDRCLRRPDHMVPQRSFAPCLHFKHASVLSKSVHVSNAY